MANPTKLELTQINARLAEENAALRAQVSEYMLQLDVAKAEIEQLQANVTKSTAARRADFQYAMSAEAQARREQTLARAKAIAERQAAAKAQAIATGKVVTVTK